MGLIPLLFAAIIIAWIINLSYLRKYLKLAYTAPSNRWNTLLGCGKIMRPKDVLANTFEYAKKYGPNSIFWIRLTPCFLTTDPHTLKEILTAKNCIDKPAEVYNGLVAVADQGLITESDPIWSQHRKLLNKVFKNKNLIAFLPDFHTEITQFLEKLEKIVDNGEALDILVILRVLGLKNATKTILKRNLELTKYNSSAMAVHFEQILHFVADMCLHRVLSINWLRKLAEINIYKSAVKGVRMYIKLINESINMAQKNAVTDSSYLANKNSVLDYVAVDPQQSGINENERYGMLAHFFVAAFETTSTTLYFAFILLAMHPEYQERVYEEVSKVLNDCNTELTVNQLDELVYLDMVFNETMRVLPIVPMVFRKVSNEDLTLSNGWTLPVGQTICIDIFRLHRSEELWGPQANKFNPDNFLPSNAAERHPYAFIPFTKGLRYCIGWRYGTLFFKMALAKIIAKFQISTDFRYENLKFENHITLKLVEEPRIRLERRKA